MRGETRRFARRQALRSVGLRTRRKRAAMLRRGPGPLGVLDILGLWRCWLGGHVASSHRRSGRQWVERCPRCRRSRRPS